MLYVDFHIYYFFSTKHISLPKTCNCLKSYECPDLRLPCSIPLTSPPPAEVLFILGMCIKEKGSHQLRILNSRQEYISSVSQTKSAKLVGLGFYPSRLEWYSEKVIRILSYRNNMEKKKFRTHPKGLFIMNQI